MWSLPANRRRGLTLVELLVTVSILMMLVVVALPAMTPTNESRRVREAVRQLNVFFSAARAQAMQTGRPVGVLLDRLPGQGRAAAKAFQVEVPPAYSGETIDAKVQLSYDTRASNSYYAVFNVTDISSGLDTKKISVGDQVQFNNQGPFYVVTRLQGGIQAQLDVRDRKTFPWPLTGLSPRVSYRFFRQPIHSAVTPLELPSAVAIDLQSSGVDDTANPPNRSYLFSPTAADVSSLSPTPVVFMFSPSGGLDRVYYNGSTTGYMLREPVFLLVGRRDRIMVPQDVTAATPENQIPNWYDPTSIWFTISPLTGVVGAKENFSTVNMISLGYGTRNRGISLVRTLARQTQTMGGR